MIEKRQPTDDQLWLCMSETMRSVILPCVEDPWARTALIRLIGLAEYAPQRGEDPTTQRLRDLTTCIDQLASRYAGISEQLPEQWPSVDQRQLLDLCSSFLVNSVGDTSEQAKAVQKELKALLLSQLNNDLDVSRPLIASFMGELNDR